MTLVTVGPDLEETYRAYNKKKIFLNKIKKEVCALEHPFECKCCSLGW